MSQILHIFRKDTRRLWVEITLSLLVLAVYVVLETRHHIFISMEPDVDLSPHYRQMDILTNIVTGLIPVSWWLLIARVVHAESLVGDRQFWITRPYEWKKLLAAKVLFFAVFILAPFAAMQSVLLAIAGFAPYRYGLGLAFNVVMACGIFLVPLMALSAVTKNFARMTLTILGMAVAVIAVAAAAGAFDSTSVSVPYADRYSIPLVLLAGGFVTVLQYARRRTWLARGILLTIPVGVGIAGFSLNSQMAVESAYPEPARAMDAPLRLVFTPDAKDALEAHEESKDEVDLRIQFGADGLTGKQAARTDDVKLVLDGAHGAHWESRWMAVYNDQFMPGSYTVTHTFSLKRAKYEELKKSPVTMRLMFAMTVMHGGAETRVLAPYHEFTTAELGICRVMRAVDGGIIKKGCRTAMHGPDMVYVSATPPIGGCRALGEGGHASAWIGSLDNDVAEFAFSPVFVTQLNLMNDRESDRLNYTSELCPGTMLSITRYTAERRLREYVEASGVQLPEVTKNKLILMEP